MLLGVAHYMLKQYAQATPVLRDCVSRAPNLRSGHIWLAATYAQLGQLEEARAEAAEVLRLEPNYTIAGTARRIVAFKQPKDESISSMGCAKRGCPSSRQGDDFPRSLSGRQFTARLQHSADWGALLMRGDGRVFGSTSSALPKDWPRRM